MPLLGMPGETRQPCRNPPRSFSSNSRWYFWPERGHVIIELRETQRLWKDQRFPCAHEEIEVSETMALAYIMKSKPHENPFRPQCAPDTLRRIFPIIHDKQPIARPYVLFVVSLNFDRNFNVSVVISGIYSTKCLCRESNEFNTHVQRLPFSVCTLTIDPSINHTVYWLMQRDQLLRE